MKFSNSLLNWYNAQDNQMPWRGEKDLYKIWLSEIMLQQTQIKTVIPYYNRWISEFPDVESVANTDENKILKLWEGLGYYSRARNFHHACKTVMEKFDGRIPESAEKFAELKGVGLYTLAAVQSIGLNQKIPVIDGNVKRVISRLLGLRKSISMEFCNIRDYLQTEIHKVSNPGDFNQALMDLGRTTCKPKNPNCHECPLSNSCIAFHKKLTDKIPFIEKKKKLPHYKMAVGMVWKDGEFLIGRRSTGKMLGGMWEMPGFKLNGATSQKCIEQLLRSESGIKVQKSEKIATAKHAYSHFSIEMDAYNCEFVSGQPSSQEHSKWRWVTKDNYKTLPFHTANHKLFKSIFGLPA